MAKVVCYDGLSSLAVTILQKRLSVAPLKKDTLKEFLSRNNQTYNKYDTKEMLALRCEKYIRDVAGYQDPPPQVRDDGKFPPCMVCLEEGTGRFALIPCGHTGCCTDCSTNMLNEAMLDTYVSDDDDTVPLQNFATRPSGNVPTPDQQSGRGLFHQSLINLGDFLVPRPLTPQLFGTRNEQEPWDDGPDYADPIYVTCPICQGPSTFQKLHFS